MGKVLEDSRQFFRDNPDFKPRKLTEEEKQGQIRPKKEHSMEQVASNTPQKPMPLSLKK